MRVGENVTVFAGDTQAALDREGTRNDRQSGEKKAVYAGGLTGNVALRDRIAQKKEQAQKRALKIVSDMWEGDRKIDQELDKSRRIAEESAETLKDARENLESIEAQKEKVRNYYGIKEGDEELVQRGQGAGGPGHGGSLRSGVSAWRGRPHGAGVEQVPGS